MHQKMILFLSLTHWASNIALRFMWCCNIYYYYSLVLCWKRPFLKPERRTRRAYFYLKRKFIKLRRKPWMWVRERKKEKDVWCWMCQKIVSLEGCGRSFAFCGDDASTLRRGKKCQFRTILCMESNVGTFYGPKHTMRTEFSWNFRNYHVV